MSQPIIMLDETSCSHPALPKASGDTALYAAHNKIDEAHQQIIEDTLAIYRECDHTVENDVDYEARLIASVKQHYAEGRNPTYTLRYEKLFWANLWRLQQPVEKTASGLIKGVFSVLCIIALATAFIVAFTT